MNLLPPVRREILVDADQKTAFEVFTSRIGEWWPLGEHGVYGSEATVAFVQDKIVERSPGGETSLWGSVVAWEPPSGIAFTWHPGGVAQRASRIEVTFTAAGDATLMVLAHSGWEVFEDPATARAEYDTGWIDVLARYSASRTGAGRLTAAAAR